MTDLLLINTPVRTAWDASFFPTGLGYIAKYAQIAGRKVEILDFNLLRPNDEEAYGLISEHKAKYIGITGMAIQFGLINKYAEMAKATQPDSKIIVGGRVTAVPNLILDNENIDVAALGDGELTIGPLLDCLDSDDDLHNVPSVAFRNGDLLSAITTTPVPPYEKELDTFGFPPYELFGTESYIDNQLRTHSHRGSVGKRSINIIASRGCLFNCSFCGEDRDAHRKRSIPSVIEEMALLKKQYDIEHVHFSDGLFFSNRNRVIEFSDALDSSGLGLTWSGNARVDIITPELLDRVMASGCNLVAYGFETGSPAMLKAMNKTTTVAQNLRTIELHHERNLPFASSMIIGAPGETWSTIFETLKFLMVACFYPSSVNYLMVYPGTPDWQLAIQNGNIKDPIEYMKQMGIEVDSLRYSDRKLLVNMSKLSDWQLWIAGRLMKKAINLRMKIADFGIRSKIRKLLRV